MLKRQIASRTRLYQISTAGRQGRHPSGTRRFHSKTQQFPTKISRPPCQPAAPRPNGAHPCRPPARHPPRRPRFRPDRQIGGGRSARGEILTSPRRRCAPMASVRTNTSAPPANRRPAFRTRHAHTRASGRTRFSLRHRECRARIANASILLVSFFHIARVRTAHTRNRRKKNILRQHTSTPCNIRTPWASKRIRVVVPHAHTLPHYKSAGRTHTNWSNALPPLCN